MHNETLNIHYGGLPEPVPDSIYPVRLYNDDNSENLNNVAAVCVLKAKTINIEDAYTNNDYDFSGPKGFDKNITIDQNHF